MKTTKISHVAHLVEICVQHGVKQVVVSPGSRNAPLVIAFDAHPKIEVFLVHDERSAAFFALGLAENSGNPVAITCTSGSAPVNYTPAITEAYYRNIPLLVLTADRPPQLIDQGDGQTIRQKNVYANFIKAGFELPNYPDREGRSQSDAIANRALLEVTAVPKGPVHINIPLSEPLYETQVLESTPEILKESQTEATLSGDQKELIKKEWLTAEKKLVIIGQLEPGELPIQQLQPILNDPGTAILVENTSNLQYFERICHCIDRTLAIIKPEEIRDFQPDLLVSFGGAIISKRIKAFFRTHKPKVNWRVGQFLIEEDTYQSLTESFKVTPRTFLNFIGSLNLVPLSNFGSKWKQADFKAEAIHSAYLPTIPFSDFKAFEIILDTLPEGTNVHMSNSSVVRYCQLFNPLRGMRYYANRGVSGIDGSTSTALGITVAVKDQLNVLITGDISFFYDSNALWNAYLPENFRIIVINNGGGGIFKIIDGPAKSDQSGYFVAPYQAKIEAICEAFNVHYMSAKTTDELESVFGEFYSQNPENRPVLLEIDTQNIENEVILKEYFSNIALT